jgi:chloramphenicol 3-O phosphotransferase
MEASMFPQIILLNGACSSGKTTFCKSLRKHLPVPYLYYSSDQLVDSGMLPELDRKTDNTPFSWNILRPRFFSGFHKSIAAFANSGSYLLVEHIIEHPDWLGDLVRLLSAFRVHYVGVMCPMEEMERRERARGNRRIGEGRSHIEDGIHTWSGYDTVIDTAEFTPEENARKLISSIETLGSGKTVFEKKFREMRKLPEV